MIGNLKELNCTKWWGKHSKKGRPLTLLNWQQSEMVTVPAGVALELTAQPVMNLHNCDVAVEAPTTVLPMGSLG